MSFEFDVSEPLRKEGAKTLDVGFWAYKITVRTSLPQYKSNAMVAVRRYSDFDWLRHQLVLSYPGYIVPPLPSKDITGVLQNISHEGRSPLLQYRQRNLLRFLMRVGAHTTLGTSRLLQDFLEMNEAEWSQRMKNGKSAQDSFASSLGRSLVHKFNALSSTPAPPDPLADLTECDHVFSYLKVLEKTFTILKGKLNDHAYMRIESTDATRDFGRALVQLSRLTDIYEDPELLRAIGEVGETTMNISDIGLQQSRIEITQLSESVQYYIGLCNAIREVLDVLVKTKKELEHINQNLFDIQNNKLKAEGSGNTAALAKYDGTIQGLTSQKEGKQSDIRNLESTIRTEMARIHHEKLYDFHQLFQCFGDVQLEYAEKMSVSWNSVVTLLTQGRAAPATTSNATKDPCLSY